MANSPADTVSDSELDARVREFEATRNTFMRQVAHNLRSPLAAVLSSLRVLDTGAITEPADVKKLQTNALIRAEDMMALVDDMLALLDQRAGTPMIVEKFDAAPIMRAVLAQLESKAAAKECSLRLDAPDEPVVINGEKKLFARMVKELADNAIKYSDPGETAVARLSQNGHATTIEFINRGLQLGEEDMKNLFVEFWRARDAKKYADHGTGLGLAIAGTIAARFGGGVFAASSVKETIFRVEIPVD